MDRRCLVISGLVSWLPLIATFAMLGLSMCFLSADKAFLSEKKIRHVLEVLTRILRTIAVSVVYG